MDRPASELAGLFFFGFEAIWGRLGPDHAISRFEQPQIRSPVRAESNGKNFSVPCQIRPCLPEREQPAWLIAQTREFVEQQKIAFAEEVAAPCDGYSEASELPRPPLERGIPRNAIRKRPDQPL